MRISLTLFFVLLSGCATTQRAADREKLRSQNYQSRKSLVKMASQQPNISSLRVELRRQESLIEELKERNLVLERRVHPVASGGEKSATTPAPANSGEVVVGSSSRNPLPFSPSANELFNRGEAPLPELPELSIDGQKNERAIYARVIETYRHHQTAQLRKNVELLLRAQRDSIFADNALYLAGLLAIENGDKASGLIYMNRVLNEYPQGNKAVSALFARSMVEKQLHKFKEARRDLAILQTTYPGSPESLRAIVELRTLEMLNGQLNKRREI